MHTRNHQINVAHKFINVNDLLAVAVYSPCSLLDSAISLSPSMSNTHLQLINDDKWIPFQFNHFAIESVLLRGGTTVHLHIITYVMIDGLAV